MNRNVVIIVIVLIVLSILIFYRKKIIANKNIMSNKITEDKELKEAIKRIYILESANYTSNIFKQTNGAGIIAFGDSFPWGWKMLENFWKNNPEFKPTGIYKSANGFGYLIFPSIEAGQLAVGEIVKKRFSQGLNAAAYNSNDPAEREVYMQSLLSIKLPDGEKIRPNKYLQV